MITDDKSLDTKTDQQIVGLCRTHNLNLFMYLRVRLLYGIIPGDLRSCLTTAMRERDSAQETNSHNHTHKIQDTDPR